MQFLQFQLMWQLAILPVISLVPDYQTGSNDVGTPL